MKHLLQKSAFLIFSIFLSCSYALGSPVDPPSESDDPPANIDFAIPILLFIAFLLIFIIPIIQKKANLTYNQQIKNQ